MMCLLLVGISVDYVQKTSPLPSTVYNQSISSRAIFCQYGRKHLAAVWDCDQKAWSPRATFSDRCTQRERHGRVHTERLTAVPPERRIPEPTVRCRSKAEWPLPKTPASPTVLTCSTRPRRGSLVFPGLTNPKCHDSTQLNTIHARLPEVHGLCMVDAQPRPLVLETLAFKHMWVDHSTCRYSAK